MKILIPGATGYIGSAVAETLAAAGHEVYGVARSERADAQLVARGLRAVRGDLTDTERLAALATTVDAVVWTATANRADIDAPAVGALVDRLAGTGKTFVYTSGVWVHGDTHGAVADERSPLDAIELVAWRVAVERQVLEGSGIRGVVLRPGVVYGRGAGIPTMLTTSVSAHGAARFIGTGENHWATVFIDDLADLYRRALEHAPSGSVFIGAHGAERLIDIAAAASRGQGAGGKTLAWPLEEARRELGAFADALAIDQRFTAQHAYDTLGWSPKGPAILQDLERGSYAR